VLKTCPVLAFTSGVESALRWFDWTHALQVIPFVGARYERVSWPAAGGAGDQDAWLTQALGHLRAVYNAILREDVKRDRAARPKSQERRRRGR
jgi:hypothetical protein